MMGQKKKPAGRNQRLLKRHELETFLKQMLTNDVKCITYDNVNRKRTDESVQTEAKPGLMARTVLLGFVGNNPLNPHNDSSAATAARMGGLIASII